MVAVIVVVVVDADVVGLVVVVLLAIIFLFKVFKDGIGEFWARLFSNHLRNKLYSSFKDASMIIGLPVVVVLAKSLFSKFASDKVGTATEVRLSKFASNREGL